MLTFLWMLYLALMLSISAYYLICIISNSKSNWNSEENTKFILITTLVLSILWSIWYFYFLH